MSLEIQVHDVRGTRHYGADDLPLVIGGGADAEIALSGALPGKDLAFVGIDQDHPFVQPAEPACALRHNERPLRESVWLRDGDVFAFQGATVAVRIDGAAVHLRVDDAHAAPVLHPPGSAPPSVGAPLAAPAPESPPGPAAAPAAGHRRGAGWLRFAVLGGFALLIAAAGFVFLATPVSLRIEPLPRHSSLSGALPVVRFGARVLALPGAYTVRADLPGYRPLRAAVTIERGASQIVSFKLRKLPGIVSITTAPVSGAQIVIDGEPAGTSPLVDAEIEAGTRRIRVTAPRYLPLEKVLQVEGMGRRQALALQLIPGWAAIDFSSTPPGAELRIDGEASGSTPTRVDLMAGVHGFELALARHDSVRGNVTVVANQPRTLPDFVLRESNGTLALRSDPGGATVAVDGLFRGDTPLELSLNPRAEHRIELARAGFKTATRTVRLGPAASKAIVVKLEPEFGVVFVTSDPPGAELLIDGKRAGSATRRLRLTTVPHQLEIRKKGYASQRESVLPRAGVSQRLSVELQRLDELRRKSSTRPRVTTADGQVLRLVRPGRIRMGASRREQGRRANESLRLVVLTRAYYLGVKEVTNAEFRRFDPEHDSGTSSGATLNAGSQPVSEVSWDQAVAYLNWLSKRDSLPPAYVKHGSEYVLVRPLTTGYRLPTEAEWAYAARLPEGGATPLKYSWGSGFPPSGKAGNFADASARGTLANVMGGYNDGYPVSAPVGSFAPNALGIFDLGGNVAEWCHDYYSVYAGASGALATDPVGPDNGKHHVVRGSSWRQASISELRLSYRDYSRKPRKDLGFRIARYAQ